STFRRSIAKHYVTSLTTLEVAARNREARLRDYYEFKRSAIEEGKTERMKRIVITPDKDRVKTAELIEVLRRAQIEVKVANSTFRSSSAHSYDEKNSVAITKDFPAGSYIVDLSQPQKRLAKALLEQDTPQDAGFVKDQTDKLKRNQLRGSNASREEYGFYDVTAWNLPLAFGVDAFWTEDVSNNFPLVTDEYLTAQKTGNVIGGRAQIAYVIPYQTDASAVLAYRLQKEGYKVAVALKQLNAVNQNFPRGTFVVRCSRNPESLHDAITRLSRELGANVQAVQTGFQETGDTGVNGENVVSLKLPRIAIVADEAVEQTSYGSIWWTFNRYGIEFTPLTTANIRNGALEKYNLLIMPDGSASRYSSQLGKDGVDTIKSWLGRGGSIVTVKGAAVFASLKDVNLSSTKLVGSADDDEKATAEDVEKNLPTAVTTDKDKQETPPTSTKTGKKQKPKITTDANENAPTQELPFDKADGAPPELPPIASPSATRGKIPEAVPGAIMRGTVDRTTWLTYGIEQNNLPVLVSSAYFFRLSKEGTNAIVFEQNPKKPLTISGFTWEGNTERLLKGTTYVIDEPQGQGHVILFAEEPFFRGIFRSNSRMFFNSLLFPSTL
ncbi:MAG: hypothetical protein H7Z37_10025, partial [Pyrinomonadaceae bacterium]|nr:hypothetical protein [Pyrinomonadaceae bacterium]